MNIDSPNQRSSIFDDETDLDLSTFAPRKKEASPTLNRDSLRMVAEAKGFASREPQEVAPSPLAPPQAPQMPPQLQRRYRTGRNRQLNLKVTDKALNQFYALADAQGLVLGEVFEQAVNALVAAMARDEESQTMPKTGRGQG